MSQLIATNHQTIVIGIGATGFSVVRHLLSRGKSVVAVDTRTAPANEQVFRHEFPQVSLVLGDLDTEFLKEAALIVVSPGVSLKEPAIQAAIDAGVRVIGDIQLFIEAVTAPIIAITGSNAKSTVTTLVGEMIEADGKRASVAGNIGTPVLDLLSDLSGGQEPDFYVLELSSFQLETVEQPNADVACLLNVSADHMDRYATMAEYHAAKQRIFFGAKTVVINRDDALTSTPLRKNMASVSFGLGVPDLKDFGVIEDQAQLYLAKGLQKIMLSSQVRIAGKHNLANALAALAIGDAIGLTVDAMVKALCEFKGLKHRCEWVANYQGVDFINDSKGTNVGATLAALEGLDRSPQNKIVLIAGGDGKGADFSGLKTVLQNTVRYMICFGKDAQLLFDQATQVNVPAEQVDTLKIAVSVAVKHAIVGDVVLLSPACASLDMFKNYEERGDKFAEIVKGFAA
ncbi:UDP-N-acetylmuramoyl-L-alanine--D-glutamate ligase [Aurantivibrio plasticivorans]